MKTLLLFALVCFSVSHAATPPDTLFQKVRDSQFKVSAKEMKLGRHIGPKGGMVGTNIFMGEVTATVGSASLLCDEATLDDKGYVFNAPTLLVNGLTITARQMTYNETRHKAVLTQVIEYNNGTHYHDYCVIAFDGK